MTAWTIRLALLCLVFSLALGSGRNTAHRRWQIQRAIWTARCFLAWVHVLLAFHNFHSWSFTHAAAETSRRTAEAIGASWGGEIWFNFAFIGLWLVDAGWRWINPTWTARLGIPSAAIQVFLLFIAFNAAVVFEDGPTRIAGVIATLILAAAFALRLLRHALAASCWGRPKSTPRSGGLR
jgi:hypothetical protein